MTTSASATSPSIADLPALVTSPAVVLDEADEAGRVPVRALKPGCQAATTQARCAIAGDYQPVAGDRVLVLVDGDESYVVGVLHAAKRTRLELPDGASVEVCDEALELRDDRGRLLVRYADGAAELCAPAGDLTLAAPHGRVRLRSALDIELAADRDVLQQAGRDLHHAAQREMAFDSPRLQVKTNDARVTSNRLSVVAHSIAQTATHWAANVERYELVADRLVEKSRSALHEVAELLQTRAGRARHFVETTFALRSRRTVMRSKKNTSIDGKRILLG